MGDTLLAQIDCTYIHYFFITSYDCNGQMQWVSLTRKKNELVCQDGPTFQMDFTYVTCMTTTLQTCYAYKSWLVADKTWITHKRRNDKPQKEQQNNTSKMPLPKPQLHDDKPWALTHICKNLCISQSSLLNDCDDTNKATMTVAYLQITYRIYLHISRFAGELTPNFGPKSSLKFEACESVEGKIIDVPITRTCKLSIGHYIAVLLLQTAMSWIKHGKYSTAWDNYDQSIIASTDHDVNHLLLRGRRTEGRKVYQQVAAM